MSIRQGKGYPKEGVQGFKSQLLLLQAKAFEFVKVNRKTVSTTNLTERMKYKKMIRLGTLQFRLEAFYS